VPLRQDFVPEYNISTRSMPRRRAGGWGLVEAERGTTRFALPLPKAWTHKAFYASMTRWSRAPSRSGWMLWWF